MTFDEVQRMNVGDPVHVLVWNPPGDMRVIQGTVQTRLGCLHPQVVEAYRADRLTHNYQLVPARKVSIGRTGQDRWKWSEIHPGNAFRTRAEALDELVKRVEEIVVKIHETLDNILAEEVDG